jgi:azurin
MTPSKSYFAVVAITLAATGAVVNAQGKQPAQLQVGTKGDEIAFDQTQLAAKPGQSIRLTFKNNASSGSRMQHSWVLTRPGAEAKVADAATKAGAEKKYIPDSPDVLAHTSLVEPGQSQTITFSAPSAPGKYPYICTFPGHYLSMHGVLDVK